MNQELLESVIGLAVAEAEEKIKAAGHETLVTPEGEHVTDILRANTVLLWEKDGKITIAQESGK